MVSADETGTAWNESQNNVNCNYVLDLIRGPNPALLYQQQQSGQKNDKENNPLDPNDLLSAVLDLVPVLGQVKIAAELISGHDLITGKALSTFDNE